MNKELAYNFLYDSNKFKEQFQRVLDRTPHERAPSKIDFWTHFFLGSSITIQNSVLKGKIEDICFSVGSSGNAKIIKLAFKVEDNGQDKVILRSISIAKNDAVPSNTKYSNNELKKIEDQFWEKNARKTADTTIDLKMISSKTLHLNIKTSDIKLQDNHIKGTAGSSGKEGQNIVKVQPLQLGKNIHGEKKTLDDFLGSISKAATADNVKSFFDKLAELYNKQEVLVSSEASYHGFTYGALILNYHIKYGIDAYVEQSAGRGFLDLYFLLRKDGKGNDISNAVKIITEFKGDRTGNNIMSVSDAVKQIEDKAYAYQLAGRTSSSDVIIVGADFGAAIEKVRVEGPQTSDPSQDFISKLINERQVKLDSTTLQKALKAIYGSTCSDESLDRVILGELLSASSTEKNIYVIKDLPHNQRASVFVFKDIDQNRVILTIIERENLNPAEYGRNFRKDPSKPETRNNIESKQVTIEEEIKDTILHIQKELNINSGKRIDITINPKGDVFEGRKNTNFYCLDIEVNDLESHSLQTTQSYISQFITRYDITSNLDINNLIPALQKLDSGEILSQPHDGAGEDMEAQSRELNKLKEELLKFKEFITLEKDLKSILHGLFLHKKFNDQDIIILTEVSSGHGRADLALLFKDDAPPLVLELGLGTSNEQIQAKQEQLRSYIKYLKAITDAREVKGVVLGFNKDATEKDTIIKMECFAGEVDHITSDGGSPIKPFSSRSNNIKDLLDNMQPAPLEIKGGSSDRNMESRQDGNRVSVGEQAGTSGISKRKEAGSDSPAKKVKFNLENLEEQGDNIGLQASGSNCSPRPSGKKRLKRDICQEKETEEIFPYEPLEETIAESSKVNARLYAQISYLIALKQQDPANANMTPDNVLTYMTNIGDIISEGEINHSLREQELLQTHYLEAQDFFNKYPKDTVLDLVGAEIDLSSHAWIFDNGKHSLLVSYDGNRYQIYSPNLNYRQSFQTKNGVRFTDIELYAEAFFKWCSNSIEYDVFTLKQNIPEEITNKIKQAKFWHPDEVVSDLILLDKGSLANIGGVPAKVVRELFFLDGKVPELTALHENFFVEYSGRVVIRLEELHHVLSSLDLQASKSLVNLVKQYDFLVDTTYLNNMPESTKSLLHSYHNEISNKLKTSKSITIQDLSDLSWKIIADKMLEHPDISPELKESSLKNVKELYSVASKRFNELGITSQTLFFLPDIIRSMNSGNFEGLEKTGGMMLGDMAFNKMYDSLISKLASILPESRIALLEKLPVASPIFKVLTIHSIIELHKELNSLPADSEEAGIIKHQLGEQYFTIGLMVAELFGLELGPLWIGLMAEQLVYGAIALRKQYHLDIPFGEAFLMNLGFEQDKLQSILTERQLADLNLSLVNRLSAQTNTSYGLVIVTVPKMSYDEAHPGNSVIEFKPKDSHFCMEDNVFLENSSGYKRISSVISDEQHNNCVETAALQISGDGLAALYSNNNSTEWQSIYVNFDPNEGDMKLHFTKEGLSRLDSANNHQQSNTNATRSYVVTAQIYHKPYPDKIGLFGNKNHSFILNDDSKRVASNYYIDGTSSFKLEDNAISTSIQFLNKKLFKGYNAYISGNTGDMQVRSIYSEDNIITGYIALKNKDYLKLNLEHLLINGKLTIDILNIEILYAKGAMMLQHNYLRNNNIIEVSPNVITFKILLEAPSIGRIDIKNKNASDVIINMQHLNNKAFTLSIQGIHTEYKSYYSFIVDDLQSVLDEMTFTSRGFPEHFIFLCSSRGSIKGWCEINNDPIKNIIYVKGKMDGEDGILTIEEKKSVLEIVKSTNKLPQDSKHIEIVNYDNVVKLEDDLRFKQVLENANYNSSAYYHYLNKHNFINWHIIEFNSLNNWTTLYHFKYSNVQINDINYFIKENKIYATLKGNIDGSKLLKDNKGKPISIFVNTTLNNSQISLEDLKEDSLEINNSTLHNLSDNIIFVFQKSGGGIFPISLRLLKDSFKYANDNIVSEIPSPDKQNLVLHNPLIYDELTVDAKNVTIVDAINVGDNGSFIIVKDSTKDFKITLKGHIHITKNYVNDVTRSIIRMNLQETDDDMQLMYEYTEKNNTGIYTVTLEHINERFFQDIQIKDTDTSKLIHFGTPKTKYDWYDRDNDILRIKVKLPDSKMGTLLINGTTYILNVYNQDEELVLQEIKYQDLQNYFPNNEELVFKNKLLNCTESYFCYYNFSPLSNIEQEKYLDLSDVSVFWSQDNNHKVLVHHPKCYYMDESKSSENLEHKNVKRGSSNGLWNFGKKLSNLVNFNLLPGAEGAALDNSKSSLSDYLLIDDPGNDQGNLQTVINSIDIVSNLSLLTLLIGQFFGINKALSSNPYISPEQEKNRYINELNKTVKSAISEMETKYGKRQITNEELEDILPSLDILFNGQEELNYNNNSTSILGKITEICNYVYDFWI